MMSNVQRIESALAKATRLCTTQSDSTKTLQETDDDEVYIVGMACRLPGDSDTPKDFWRTLESFSMR